MGIPICWVPRVVPRVKLDSQEAVFGGVEEDLVFVMAIYDAETTALCYVSEEGEVGVGKEEGKAISIKLLIRKDVEAKSGGEVGESLEP